MLTDFIYGHVLENKALDDRQHLFVKMSESFLQKFISDTAYPCMPISLLICFSHIFCVQNKIYHPSEIFFYDGIYDILFHILLAFREYTVSRIRTCSTNMYTAVCLINSVHCTNVLSGMPPFFIRSAFVHDTPDPGNDQATAGKAVSRVSCPSVVLTEPPSLRDPASLQGCDWTGVSLSSSVIIAHCSCHLPFETRHSRSLRRGHGASFHMLTVFTVRKEST